MRQTNPSSGHVNLSWTTLFTHVESTLGFERDCSIRAAGGLVLIIAFLHPCNIDLTTRSKELLGAPGLSLAHSFLLTNLTTSSCVAHVCFNRLSLSVVQINCGGCWGAGGGSLPA